MADNRHSGLPLGMSRLRIDPNRSMEAAQRPVNSPDGFGGSRRDSLPMPGMDEFDPFRVFEVEHRPCMILTAHVMCGRNISNGWMADMLDTPDPYVVLKMKSAPDGRKRTKHIDNDVNPVWDEQFTFLMDSSDHNVLQVILRDANYLQDHTIGFADYNIGGLTMNEEKLVTFQFINNIEVDVMLRVDFDTDPDLRYSLCLSDDEKRFVDVRRRNVIESMNSLLGSDCAPQTLWEVPTIGILGSGGGFRAMVGLAGAMKALYDSNILDCAMYVAGLSGSTWYLSTLYSHSKWPSCSPEIINDELKNRIDSSLLWLLKPQSVYRYVERILQKRRLGQPVSFTDFFGHLVGETLLKDRLEMTLSDQQDKVNEGQAPLPLYTCVHVKKDVSAKVFQEWVEFSPYEIGMPKYGTFMRTEQFGSKFFMGKISRKFEEPPLHFLQGMWGSAFTILFKRLLDDTSSMDPVDIVRSEMANELDLHDEESSDCSDDPASSDDDSTATESGSDRRRSSSGTDSCSGTPTTTSRPKLNRHRRAQLPPRSSRQWSSDASDFEYPGSESEKDPDDTTAPNSPWRRR
ncbi:unnamed protein product, partial [Owenia fusiformis]